MLRSLFMLVWMEIRSLSHCFRWWVLTRLGGPRWRAIRENGNLRGKELTFSASFERRHFGGGRFANLRRNVIGSQEPKGRLGPASQG